MSRRATVPPAAGGGQNTPPATSEEKDCRQLGEEWLPACEALHELVEYARRWARNDRRLDRVATKRVHRLFVTLEVGLLREMAPSRNGQLPTVVRVEKGELGNLGAVECLEQYASWPMHFRCIVREELFEPHHDFVKAFHTAEVTSKAIVELAREQAKLKSA